MIDYSVEVQRLGGDVYSLSEHKGAVMLIVNTATKCGLSGQLKELEQLHQSYGERGLKVLGFPCAQFANQEYSDSEKIAEVCQVNFGVTFDLHALIDVNGDDTHPLFQTLKSEQPGVLGTEGIKWNFTKFLVSRDGTILKRYGPKVSPTVIVPDIEKAL